MLINKIYKVELILCACLVAMSSLLFAQNKLSITKRAPVYLNMKSIHNAGKKGRVLVDQSQWLNYTVLVAESDPTVSISVAIGSGSVPAGFEMYIEAKEYRGFSNGKIGTPVGKIALSNMPQVLIDNIGTSYTGSGRNEGHQLKISFVVKDYAKIEPGICTLFIQYTITQ